jgi:hypothetical protein
LSSTPPPLSKPWTGSEYIQQYYQIPADALIVAENAHRKELAEELARYPLVRVSALAGESASFVRVIFSPPRCLANALVLVRRLAMGRLGD